MEKKIYKYEDLTTEMLDAFKRKAEEWECDIPRTMSELESWVRESDEYEGDTDMCYVYEKYTLVLDTYIFSWSSTSYRKDTILCEPHFDDYILAMKKDDYHRKNAIESYKDLLYECEEGGFSIEDIKGLIEAEKLNLL